MATEIKQGDHVYVRRGLGPLGYTHHGIAFSPYTVIHFAGGPSVSKAQAVIRYASIQGFAAGAQVKIRHYKHRKFAPEEIVRRAQSQLGQADYHLLGRNCEHFATWCVTGADGSEQVGLPLSMIVGGVGGAVAVAVAPAGAAALAGAAAVAGAAGLVVSSLTAYRKTFRK